MQRKRPGEYWIHGGSFIGGGGFRHAATAEDAADYMGQSPHRTVLMTLTKELGWEDVHRYLGLTKYGRADEIADTAKLGGQLWSLEFSSLDPRFQSSRREPGRHLQVTTSRRCPAESYS